MFWKNDDGDDVFFLSREEARKRKKKWKEKRGERRTEFGRVSCNESLSLENALAFLLLDEPKMRERGTEMACARKRKKGREGVGRDAIEFFFFFFSKRLCSWHTLRDIEPVSLFQKAHSSFAPLRTLAASPSIGTPRGALASS